MYKLTDKQQAFVDAYLITLNATKAAKIAGYSEKTARQMGAENLSKPVIFEIIQKRLEENAMSANEVISRLSDHARGDMADFITIKNGIPFFDLEKAEQAGKLHLLKKIRQSKQGVEIELYDAQAALVQLGRYHALFTDRQEINGVLHWGDIVKDDLEDAQNSGDPFA